MGYGVLILTIDRCSSRTDRSQPARSAERIPLLRYVRPGQSGYLPADRIERCGKGVGYGAGFLSEGYRKSIIQYDGFCTGQTHSLHR